MTVTAPTAPYRATAPAAHNMQTYLGWFVDRVVRTARGNGYAQICDPAIELVLSEFGVRTPAGGFVDSDGRNARGTLVAAANVYGPDGFNAQGFDRDGFGKDGFNADGENADGQTRDDVVAAMVDSWSGQTAAAILTLLAERAADHLADEDSDDDDSDLDD